MAQFSKEWVAEGDTSAPKPTQLQPCWSRSNTPCKGMYLSLDVIHILFLHSDFFFVVVLSEQFLVCCATNFLFVCFSLSITEETFCLSCVTGAINYLCSYSHPAILGLWAEPDFHISLPDGVWLVVDALFAPRSTQESWMPDGLSPAPCWTLANCSVNPR